MWMVRLMGGLGSHMVTLTQLHALEISYILTHLADGPVWRTPRDLWYLCLGAEGLSSGDACSYQATKGGP